MQKFDQLLCSRLAETRIFSRPGEQGDEASTVQACLCSTVKAERLKLFSTKTLRKQTLGRKRTAYVKHPYPHENNWYKLGMTTFTW